MAQGCTYGHGLINEVPATERVAALTVAGHLKERADAVVLQDEEYDMAGQGTLQ